MRDLLEDNVLETACWGSAYPSRTVQWLWGLCDETSKGRTLGQCLNRGQLVRVFEALCRVGNLPIARWLWVQEDVARSVGIEAVANELHYQSDDKMKPWLKEIIALQAFGAATHPSAIWPAPPAAQ